MRIAYLDCFSGISGDMTLAALVDAGADPHAVERELQKLPVEPFRLEWRTVVKKGVSARKVDVVTDGAGDSRHAGHGPQHRHGPQHEGGHHPDGHGLGGGYHPEGHGHHHANDPHHAHDHDHDHHHAHDHDVHDHHHPHDDHHHHHHDHDHAHHHRTYSEIVEMISRAGFRPRVTERALAVFRAIGEAEAKIHNIPLETVHFHEVGALDSIVDVVGVALALEELAIDEVWSGPVPTGNGYVRCQHGLYPVPAPATLEMLKGIPLRATTIQRELTTPTGAGFAAALVARFGPLPSMRVDAIGYGAGTRDLPDQPNVLRVLVGTPDLI